MEKYSEEVVGFEGLSKVGDMLKEVPVEFRDAIMRGAYKKALRTVVKPGLMSATPYDTITCGRKGKVRTIGKKNFIIVTHGKNLKGIPDYNPTQMIIGFSQAVYPMRWVEYGSKVRRTETYAGKPFKKKTPKNGFKNIMDLTPNPFVRTYYQGIIQGLQEYVKNEFANEIDKIIKKQLRK